MRALVIALRSLLRLLAGAIYWFGWTLVGFGLLGVAFAFYIARADFSPWPLVAAGVLVAGSGGLLVAIRSRSRRYRPCPSCGNAILKSALKCWACASWFTTDARR